MPRLVFLFPSLLLVIAFLHPQNIRAAECNEIYFNKDARSFFTRFPTRTLYSSNDYAYADINNDGNLDVVAVIAEMEIARIITFLGDGRGNFRAVRQKRFYQWSSIEKYSIKLIHLNDDSILDLAVFGNAYYGSYIYIYFGSNTGDFTFQASSDIDMELYWCCPLLVDMLDINGDGRKDLLITETDYSYEAGKVYARFHPSNGFYGYNASGTPLINGANSVLVEDFNDDGRKDVAATFSFTNLPPTNHLYFYYNQGNGSFSRSPHYDLGSVARLRLAHDFNRDGWKDFVATKVYSPNQTSVSVLYNNAAQGYSAVDYPLTINSVAPFYDLKDFDGDGMMDFAAFNEHGYNIYLRERAGGFKHSYQYIHTKPALISDFNSDKKADILQIVTNEDFRTTTFQLYEADCFRRGRPDVIDFIGNGRVNFASWQRETGRWTYTDDTYPQIRRAVFWGSGALGDIPVPGDYDGDGVTDPAVYREPTGTWYVNAGTQGTIIFQLGANGDKPVPADFDADFKTDFAVFRPETGTWLVLLSESGRLLTVDFGLTGDKPVPADYDGDGKADLAVFRPSDGTWHYLKSSNGETFSFQLGQAGDVPQPTDVDSDGRADFNVFRPSTNTFHFASSSDGRSLFPRIAQGGIPQPGSGFLMNKFYNYRPENGAWMGNASSYPITYTPPGEIPVSYVLPVGN